MEKIFEELFEKIKHGDKEHQDWLRSEMNKFLKQYKNTLNQEERAIRFAEWVTIKGWIYNSVDKIWTHAHCDYKTTKELYALFEQENKIVLK